MPGRWTARTAFPSIAATLTLLLLAAATPLAGTEEASAGEDDFKPPQIILSTQKQPVYPPAAYEARYTGSVLVEMTVLKDGSVGDVKVVECTRPKVGFEQAATAAVKKWRFEPGTEGGKPIEVATRLKLNFTHLKGTPEVTAGSFSSSNTSGGSAAPSPSGTGK